MKWFRKHVKQGSRLALFALVLQLAPSFGPFHGFAAQAAPAALSGPAMAAGSDAADSRAASPGSRAGRDHDHQPADNCGICAVMTLTGTALISPPPILLLPEAIEFLYRAADAEFVHLKSVGTAVHPRIPPAS